MSPQRCQDQACALQTCLSRNTYSPEKCDQYVRTLYRCCLEMYNDANTGSTACPAKQVIERWLKRHPEVEERR